jgi:stress response protein SCP2
LDASAFVLDSKGNYVDLCYFGQLTLFDGAISHSGDNKDGQGEGDDETITINLASVPSQAHMIYFVCNSFAGRDFSDVDGETVHLYVDGKLQMEIDIDSSSAGSNNAFLCCRLARNNSGGWTLKATGVPATITSIRALLPVAQEASRDLVSDITISNAPACVSVTKNETIRMGRQSTIKIGLGWEFKEAPIDLDANCATFDPDGQFLEKCYFGAKNIANGAINHQGDNRSGHGEGDDETIICNLDALDASVGHIGISITSYKLDLFSKLEDASCRILDANDNPVCRFEIAEPLPVTAYLFAVLSRDGQGGWNFNAVGIHGHGKSVSKTLKPLREIIQHGVTNSHGRSSLPEVVRFQTPR